MTSDLADVAAPQHTALVTQEIQGAVVGPNAGLGALARAAQRHALPEMARFMSAMRRLQDIPVSTAPDGELWTDRDGTVLSEANGLMIKLRPHQP